jgi:outer membrane protein assembly factor BamB
VPFKGNRVLLRRILPLLAILLSMAVILSGCYGRGQPKGWSGATVASDSIFVGSLDGRLVGFQADGSLLWLDEEAGMLGTAEAKVAIYGTPAVAGDLVYIGGYTGKVYAFVLSTGALRWVYPREGNLDSIVGGVVASQGKVYLSTSGGIVYALDAATGDKLWSFETGDKIWSTPAISGDTLYVTSFDKKLYALNASNGSQKWDFEIGATSITTPLVYENMVYIGSFDRHFYAVDVSTGSLRWQSEVEGGKWFWAKAVAQNNVIYAPNLDGKVYILSAENGSEVASAVDLGNPISSDPVLVGDKVIIATEEGTVFSLDTTSYQKGPLIVDVREEIGDIAKNIDRKIYAPLSADNGVVYIKAQTSSEDALYAVNVGTQETLWSQSLVIVTSEGD